MEFAWIFMRPILLLKRDKERKRELEGKIGIERKRKLKGFALMQSHQRKIHDTKIGKIGFNRARERGNGEREREANAGI